MRNTSSADLNGRCTLMMTKIKELFKKLPVALSVWGVIILVGLILFFVLGFNPSASVGNNKSVVVKYDSYVTTSTAFEEKIKSLCNKEFEKAGVTVVEIKIASNELGGYTEFVTDGKKDLSGVIGKIETAIDNSTDATIVNARHSITVESVTNQTQYVYTYVWRAAISTGVMLVLAFIYVFIRYSLAMALTTLLGGLGDLAVVLSITAMQIPATPALAVMSVFVVLYSILLSFVFFNGARKVNKSEEFESASIEEKIEPMKKATQKQLLILSATVLVFAVFFAIFGGEMVRASAITALLAVLSGAYSVFVVKPALFKELVKVGENKKAKKKAIKPATEVVEEK